MAPLPPAHPPRSLLVINPNTSTTVSALLQQRLRAQLADQQGLQIQTLTARFGAPYIACEASYAVAQHAVLDSWAQACQQGLRPDAVLIGCFGDPGLFALRDCAGLPVTGLAEAACAAAARHGRFAIVTGGARWQSMLERLCLTLGYGPQLAGVLTVAPSGAQLAAAPAAAQQLLGQACLEATRRFRVDALIIGGAGLAGLAAQIAPEIALPLIDSVTAGADWARHALLQGQQRDAHPPPGRFGVAWQSLSPEMQALG